MKSVGQHMMQDEGGTARRPYPSLRHTQEILIEFRFAEAVQIFEGLRHGAALEFGKRFNRRVIVRAQTGYGEELESVHPKDFVGNGVEHLVRMLGRANPESSANKRSACMLRRWVRSTSREEWVRAWNSLRPAAVNIGSRYRKSTRV